VADLDLLAEVRGLDRRVADDARTLPAADQPGEGGELGGKLGIEGELHQRGVCTRRYTTYAVNHTTTTAVRMSRHR
jgi:hypothetical protein